MTTPSLPYYEPVAGQQKTKISQTSQGKVVRTHYCQFRLFTNDSPWTPDAGVQFVSLSGIGQFTSHPADPQAWVESIEPVAELTRNPWTFLINVNWSTETPDQQQADRENDDPLDDAIEIEVNGEIATLPLWRDLNKKLIANSAGEPIVGLERRRQIEVVQFTRNEASKNPTRDRAFRGKVNLYKWNGADIGTVMCESITTKRSFRKRQEYWPYTYVFKYNPDGHEPTPLNAGLYQLRFGKRYPCQDGLGAPATEPMPLYTATSHQIPSNRLPDDAEFLDFTTIDSADFAQLNLPQQ